MSLLPAVLLVPAGVVAGVVGSAGGITSLGDPQGDVALDLAS